MDLENTIVDDAGGAQASMVNNYISRNGPRGKYRRYVYDTDDESDERVVPYSTRMRWKRKKLLNSTSNSNEEQSNDEPHISLENISSTIETNDVSEEFSIYENNSVNNESSFEESLPDTLIDDAPEVVSSDEEMCLNFDLELANGTVDHEENQNGVNNSLLNKILNEGSELSTGIAVLNTLELYVENNFTKKGLDGLLKLIKTLLPQPNNYPKNKYMLDKFLNEVSPSHQQCIKKHRYCEFCWLYLGEWSKTRTITHCSNCNSNNIKGLYHVEYDLKSMLKDAFEKRHMYLLMDQQNEKLSARDEYISDISDGSEFIKLKCNAIRHKYDVCIIWNTDGAPLSNSSKSEVWPIQVQVVNIPHKYRRSFQFICSMHYGIEGKPSNMNAFLLPWVNTLKELCDKGIDWFHAPSGRTINSKVFVLLGVLDAPARAAAANHMQYNGKFACFYCEHPGESCKTGKGHNYVFPPLGITLPVRSKQKVILQGAEATIYNLKHVKGVKGMSVLSSIPYFDIVLGLPPDYMHCLAIGAADMLLDLYLNYSKNYKPYYIEKSDQLKISQFLLEIKPPDYIKRIPRDLEVRKSWKATESMDFLLNYSPIIFKTYLRKKYYEHYLTLVFAIHILLKPKIHPRELDLAEKLLKYFASKCEELFGTSKCSFNVHQLIHLVFFVRRWGPISDWSAFPFEDGIRYIKNLVHGTNKIDMEIANSIKYVNAYEILKSTLELQTEDCQTVSPIGPTCNHLLEEDDIAALENLSHFNGNNDKIDIHNVTIYSRAKINNEIYTSELYKLQVKRNNFNIITNNGIFGVIKFFVLTENSLLAIVRQFVKNDSKDKNICHSLHIDFSSYIFPIVETYCIKVIDCNCIDKKVLRVGDYLCLLPKGTERR